MFAVASAVQDVSQLQLSCFRFELFLISLYCRKQRGERTEVQLAETLKPRAVVYFLFWKEQLGILCKSTYLNDLFSAALCVGLSVVGRLCSLRYFDDPMMELQ